MANSQISEEDIGNYKLKKCSALFFALWRGAIKDINLWLELQKAGFQCFPVTTSAKGIHIRWKQPNPKPNQLIKATYQHM